MKEIDENQQASDESLARLLKLAGPRTEPAAHVRQEVYDGVHAAWQAGTRRSRMRRRLLPIVAASVIGVLAVLLWPHQQLQPVFAGTVGTLDRGGLEFLREGDWREFEPGDTVSGDTVVRTGSSLRAGVLMANGISVRLDYDTQMRFETPTRLALNHGRLYIDTAGQRSKTALEIVTANGVVRDIGTQFEVQSDATSTRVRVRDGEIILDSAIDKYHAIRGEQLSVVPGGKIVRLPFSSRDAAWSWTFDVAPKFDTDGRLVTELVDWVARETGREADYADARTRNAAASTRISGSVSGQTPEETLELALETTRFRYRLDDWVLAIEKHE